MSDLYLRVIPTDPAWQPTGEAAAAVARHVAGVFTGLDRQVDAVSPLFHDRITLIDAGEHMEDVLCPGCGATIGLDWFWDLLRELNGGRIPAEPTFDDLGVIVPCCGAPLTLPELRFEAPIGFARFEVSVVNWTRGTGELSDAELTAIGEILGHPVTQIHTRY